MTGAARCPVKGCPVRYRGGPDRLCPGHAADANHDAQLTRGGALIADRRDAAQREQDDHPGPPGGNQPEGRST